MPYILQKVGATTEEYTKDVIDMKVNLLRADYRLIIFTKDLTFSDLITALPLLEKRVNDIFQTLDACRSPVCSYLFHLIEKCILSKRVWREL